MCFERIPKTYLFDNMNVCRFSRGHVVELKTGIFARRAMVDQAREGLCYQKETNVLVYLT